MDKDLAPARCGQLRLTRAALLASVVLPIVCLVILAGCAMHSDWQKPPEEYARPPRADSLFAAAEQRIADRHGPDHSGFALLERGDRTLQWRLVLIDSAQYSICLLYTSNGKLPGLFRSAVFSGDFNRHILEQLQSGKLE